MKATKYLAASAVTALAGIVAVSSATAAPLPPKNLSSATAEPSVPAALAAAPAVPTFVERARAARVRDGDGGLGQLRAVGGVELRLGP